MKTFNFIVICIQLLFFVVNLKIVLTSSNRKLIINDQPKVVIIGAGVAGIAAAQRLMQNGIKDVTILESMDRIGGRIHYIPFGEKEGVDIGAHWIHGEEDNPVFEIAEPLGLINHSGDLVNQQFFHNDGSELKLDRDYISIYDNLFGDVHLISNNSQFKTLADISDCRIEEYGKSIGLEEKDIRGLQLHARRNLCTLEGCDDVSDVSLKASRDYEEGSGDRLIEWKEGGMENILKLLMGTHEKSPWKELGVDKKIILKSRAKWIDWSSINGATVVCENRLTKSADFVIFTPSLNVLKNKHQSMFHPPLPQRKVQAIKKLGMGIVDKIVLVFNERWWPLNVTGFIPLQTNEFPSQTQDWGEGIIDFDGEHHNPLVLSAWIIGKAAKKMEQASIREVYDTTLRILKQYVGKTYDIPDPAFILRSRWWLNQDIAGSYSYNSVASESMDKIRSVFAQPLVNKYGKPVVLFAGEATNNKHYSTVHGALETGWREADRIIEYLKN